MTTVTTATADAAAAPPPPQGIKWVPAIISIAVGLVVRYLVPIPVGVTEQAWQLLSIFLATVTGARARTAYPTGTYLRETEGAIRTTVQRVEMSMQHDAVAAEAYTDRLGLGLLRVRSRNTARRHVPGAIRYDTVPTRNV